MAYPEHQSIERTAYRLWEERGRPEGRDQECWYDAEAELHRQVWSLAVPDGGPAVNNLDRALPPAERQRARAERTKQGGVTEAPDAGSGGHFIVVLSRGHLRIYRARAGGRAQAQFELAESFEIEAGRPPYAERDPAQTASGARNEPKEGSAVERLPMQIEQDRRLAVELAGQVTRFLAKHAAATWDYAAGPALHHAVLERLPPPVRGRLGIALRKELIHQSPAELRTHFALQPNGE